MYLTEEQTQQLHGIPFEKVNRDEFIVRLFTYIKDRIQKDPANYERCADLLSNINLFYMDIQKLMNAEDIQKFVKNEYWSKDALNDLYLFWDGDFEDTTPAAFLGIDSRVIEQENYGEGNKIFALLHVSFDGKHYALMLNGIYSSWDSTEWADFDIVTFQQVTLTETVGVN